MSEGTVVRPARAGEGAALAAIFNEAVEDRVATFQTWPSTAEQFEDRIASAGPVPVLVAGAAGARGWAAIIPYSERPYYGGVGEYQVYVARTARGSGVGQELMRRLIRDAELAGYWKLVGKLFATNQPSIRLARACGFREVGVHVRHSRLDGAWLDVVIVERLLGDAAG